MPTKAPISSVNDFVVRFANVNGSGSASANELFARAVLRMGIPVAPRNIFPSNIQGLPTWYEVRVNKSGHTSRALDYDLMVAMNSQTYSRDVAEVRLTPRFLELHTQIWHAMKAEVLKSYAQQQNQ